MSKHIVVTGATGSVGRGVAERLLARKLAVKAIGRNAARLAPLVERGAEAVVGSLDDPATLARAFTGAAGVFVMVPPDYQADDMLARQVRIVAALAAGLGAAGAPPTVALSSVGADHERGTGPIVILHRLEQALRAVRDLPLTILRPAYFMENHLGSLPVVKQHGLMGSTLSPDRAFAQIAVRDIVVAAAELLSQPASGGVRVQPLLGPRDVSMAEVARVLGTAIGRPKLPYARMEEPALREGLRAAGFAPKVAELFLELNRGLESGLVFEPRTAENTTPTTLDQFAADTFAPAFQA